MDPSALAGIITGASDKATQAAYMPFRVALGASQYFKANKALKQLAKTPMARYDVTPEMQRSYNRAEELANVGYSGAERGALQQQLALSQNRSFRNALSMSGGNSARGLSGALGASRLAAGNQMALNDAMLRRQNMRYADQTGNVISSQRNRQTAQDLAYRMELERNLGRARAMGIENIANAIGGQALMASARGGSDVGGMGGGGGFDRFAGMQGYNNYYTQQPNTQGGGYTQPDAPYSGGFNLPPSQIYNWGV